MPVYHILGSIPKKRHTQHRGPDGQLYPEQLMGNKGFWGPASLMYHLRNPTQVKAVRHLRDISWEADPNQAVRLRHFFGARLEAKGSAILDRVPLLFNQMWPCCWSSRLARHIFLSRLQRRRVGVCQRGRRRAGIAIRRAAIRRG